jgi:hypothetical protein
MTSATCPNCSATRTPDSLFCENCGYDFLTESLPESEAPSVLSGAGDPVTTSDLGSDRLPRAGESLSGGETGADPGVPGGSSVAGASAPGAGSPNQGPAQGGVVRLTVAVDRSYFDEVVQDGELDFPDQIPVPVELELSGPELHIGRTSESRAIHPDIDVADLTGDQAVSSRHAVLRVDGDGSCRLTDIGSTNGTFVGTFDGDPLDHGSPVVLEPGVPVYLGAWTRITVTE